LWGEIKTEQSLVSFMRVIQKLKIQNRCKWKLNHRHVGFRPSCSQPRSHSQWFPFVFAFKETSGWPEVSWRREAKNEVTTWLHVQAAEFCNTRIQTLIPRLNKYLDKGGDYGNK